MNEAGTAWHHVTPFRLVIGVVARAGAELQQRSSCGRSLKVATAACTALRIDSIRSGLAFLMHGILLGYLSNPFSRRL
jgi:hypothetical protein